MPLGSSPGQTSIDIIFCILSKPQYYHVCLFCHCIVRATLSFFLLFYRITCFLAILISFIKGKFTAKSHGPMTSALKRNAHVQNDKLYREDDFYFDISIEKNTHESSFKNHAALPFCFFKFFDFQISGDSKFSRTKYD